MEEWRPHQRELIDQILSSEKKAVLLEAMPGAGKSLIAASIALLSKRRVLILTKTLQLQAQYLQDFPFMANLSGKDNYTCHLKGATMPVSKAPCQSGYRCPIKDECPYFVQRREAMSSRVVVSNYAQAFSTYLGKFDWVICDEGHLLEAQILAANTIKLDYDIFMKEGYPIPPFGSIHEAKNWALSKHTLITRQMSQYADAFTKDDHPFGSYELRKRYVELKNLSQQLTQLTLADEDALWSMEPYKKAFYIRPIWASSFSHTLFNSATKVLVQSATILDGGRLAALLGITSYDYISIPHLFPKERRPIYVWPVAPVGMNASEADLTKTIEAIDLILDHYKERRGIIHTVNMSLTQEIEKRSRHKTRLIVQTKGQNRNQTIDRFLRTPYSVLVSPSVMTGLDGKFSRARFQIIAKMPFEDQGDQSTIQRMEQDPQWYAYKTAFNLQQAAGRVVRDRWDQGDTWIIDSHFSWFAKRNRHLLSDWFKEALQSRELAKL